jgi:hypothetical protein
VLGPYVLDDRGVSAVIEVRTYRAKPGMREPLLDLLRSRAFPLHRKLGMKVLGPFPSQEDDVTFVWLRGFPDESSRVPLKAALYEGTDWLEGLEALILPMLDDYTAVVVRDSGDLWPRWPAETTTTTGPEGAGRG